jgi:CIC family chloride channel protein
VMSYGSGGAGGIFAPTLFIGGMLGGAVGFMDRTFLHHLGDAPGAFALVGMGAVFAGVVRAPITSVLIIFEMTGSYRLILPLMISNMICYGLARRFRPTPIYEALLQQDGIHLPHQRVLAEITVAEAMSSPVETIPATARFDDIMERIRGTTHSAFPVVDAEGLLIGVLTLEDLRPHLGDTDLGRVVVAADLCRTSATARATDSLEAALTRIGNAEIDHLIIVAPGRVRLVVGILTRRDILEATGRREARRVRPPRWVET